jgi:hypothetical protein
MRYPAALLIVMLLLPVMASALSDTGTETGALLESAESDMLNMIEQGLSVTRYNDTLQLAKQMYEGQVGLDDGINIPDYSIVDEKVDELAELRDNAFRAMDELKALKITINQTADIDRSSVLDIMGEAEEELNSERYEQCLKLIDRAYERISELEAIQTKIVAFYEATSRTVVQFLLATWREVAVAIFTAVIIFFLTRNRIKTMLIKRRIRGLERRRDSIKYLVGKTQKEYFTKGKISESSYQIRTKKYGELIRDINRQIPLHKAELAMKQKRKI